MSYEVYVDYTFKNHEIKDEKKIMSILSRKNKNKVTVDSWLDSLAETGDLTIINEFSDHDNYIENILSEIAPYICGHHVIDFEGEDGEWWAIVIDDGKAYYGKYKRVLGELEEW
jgi:hypothetical protein